MLVRFMNFYLMVFWLVLGGALLLRNSLFPELFNDPERQRHYSLLAWVALALALWNLIRWYASRAFRPPTTDPRKVNALLIPLAQKDKRVVEPQFRFDDDANDSTRPQPGRNGNTSP